MIHIRNGVWETNSSSIHVMAIGKNPEYEIEFPMKLEVRLADTSPWDVKNDPTNMQKRLDCIIKFILAGSSTAKAVYSINSFITFIQNRANVKFEYHWLSFDTSDRDYEYEYDSDMVDVICEEVDVFHKLYGYLTNSKSDITDIDNNYPERVEEMRNDPDLYVAYSMPD